MIRRSAQLLVLVLAGCAAPRPPELPCAVDGRHGTVRAARHEDALAIDAEIDRIAPLVASALPGATGTRLDVRVVPTLHRAHWGGATITTGAGRWIELPEGRRDAAAQAVLAHELVHFWLDTEWNALPPVLEEGLAIRVAHVAVPEAAPRERGQLALALATLFDGSVTVIGPGVEQGEDGARFTSDRTRYTLSARIERGEVPPLREALGLSGDSLAALDAPGARAVLDALAYVLVDRIGIERLRRLCVQAGVLGHARIPDAWIWSAARVDPDEPILLEHAARAMLSTAEIRALLQREDLELRPAERDRP